MAGYRSGAGRSAMLAVGPVLGRSRHSDWAIAGAGNEVKSEFLHAEHPCDAGTASERVFVIGISRNCCNSGGGARTIAHVGADGDMAGASPRGHARQQTRGWADSGPGISVRATSQVKSTNRPVRWTRWCYRRKRRSMLPIRSLPKHAANGRVGT